MGAPDVAPDAPPELDVQQDDSDTALLDGCDPAVTETCLELCEDCVWDESSENPDAVDPGYQDGFDLGTGGTACPAGTLVQDNRCRYGTALGNYRGVSAYSNYLPPPATPFGVDGARRTGRFGYHFQCVEYIVRFMSEALGYEGLNGNGNAKTWWTRPGTSAGQALRRFPNGGDGAPQPDDIIVFDGGTYGHIGIIRTVGPNFVTIIHQNWFHNTADSATRLAMTVSNGQYTVARLSPSYPVLGWLRDPRTPDAGCSTDSDCETCNTCNAGTCQAPPALATPVTTGPANGTAVSGETTLSWDAVPGATRYRVRIGDNAASVASAECATCSEFVVESASSYNWTPPAGTGQIFWSVRAGNDCSGSEWSAVRTIGFGPATCTGASSRSCGNCGNESRTCSGGTWSTWSACAGEGACAAGATQACDGGATRTCSATCSWNPCTGGCSTTRYWANLPGDLLFDEGVRRESPTTVSTPIRVELREVGRTRVEVRGCAPSGNLPTQWLGVKMVTASGSSRLNVEFPAGGRQCTIWRAFDIPSTETDGVLSLRVRVLTFNDPMDASGEFCTDRWSDTCRWIGPNGTCGACYTETWDLQRSCLP